MILESTLQNAGEFGETLRRDSSEACCAVRKDAGQLIDSASERIRQNPVPVVMAAVAFGVAIGCLIMSGRHTPTMQERYVSEPLGDAADAISSSLHRLYGNLKFW